MIRTQSEIEFRPPVPLAAPGFHGSDYNPALDKARLTGQLARIVGFLADGRWRTLSEIWAITGAPEASVSAQLRNLRQFHRRNPLTWKYDFEKRRRGRPSGGLWEYRLIKLLIDE